MSMALQRTDAVPNVTSGDISQDLTQAANARLVVGVDIETSGLNWAADAIASVQVSVPDAWIEIARIEADGPVPSNLIGLLQSPDVLKVFHHAMFDLRFMRNAWGVVAARVACTKVAAKLRHPSGGVGHSLGELLEHYLGVEIDKREQLSDWQSADLTDEQIAYAANDVRYLTPLLYALLADLRRDDLERLALRCFDHIPTRVELEVGEFGDVFTY